MNHLYLALQIWLLNASAQIKNKLKIEYLLQRTHLNDIAYEQIIIFTFYLRNSPVSNKKLPLNANINDTFIQG